MVNKIYFKFVKLINQLNKRKWKKELRDKNFTIISNNCWGGLVYQSLDMEYRSPTVGLYIMPKDYIIFVSEIENYLKMDLRFISFDESKYASFLYENHKTKFPIGVLGDVEIFFLHYDNETTAKEKWMKRIQRINWNKVIYKFNDQNECSDEDLYDFDKLNLPNKVIFTVRDNLNLENGIFFKKNKHLFIDSSHEPFGHNRTFDVIKYINSL